MEQNLANSPSNPLKHIHATSYCNNTNLIRTIQVERGEPKCFMTDERFLCQKTGCQWYSECTRLVAAWLR